MIEEEVSETTRSYTLLSPAARIDAADLPQSPRRIFAAAEACGWETRAWLAVGQFGPSYYASNSDEGAKKQYNRGDVNGLGYTARMFAVEARHLSVPLGFHAHFTGKTDSNEKRLSLGGFEFAKVADPVGIPFVANHQYRPIRQTRTKWDTEESFNERVENARLAALRMTDEYNDGTVSFMPVHYFMQSKPFEAWIAEWLPYFTTTTKEATVA